MALGLFLLARLPLVGDPTRFGLRQWHSQLILLDYDNGRTHAPRGWRCEHENMWDKDIARLNVEHFRRLLATDINDAKRHTLLQLLAEEEAKLAALNDRRQG
jgi:hypothetical protein